jgi:quinol monooxygenase YgiN
MYGSVGRLQIKPGWLDEVKRVIQELEEVPGVLAMSLVGKDGSASKYCWTIVWTDRGAHDAHAHHIDFPARQQRLRDTLTRAPDWHAGKIVYAIPR